MIQAKIEIRVRNVDYTMGRYQHLFIIHTESQGIPTLLRGGPEDPSSAFNQLNSFVQTAEFQAHLKKQQNLAGIKAQQEMQSGDVKSQSYTGNPNAHDIAEYMSALKTTGLPGEDQKTDE